MGIGSRPDDARLLEPCVTLLGIAAAAGLPCSFLALWRLIRHRTPERSIGQIGRAVLDALEYEGSVDRRAGDFRIDCKQEQKTEQSFAGSGVAPARNRRPSFGH